MLKDYQEKILELLEQLESEVSGLYRLFAEKYPKYKDLWIELSNQETEHADYVRRLHEMAKDNKVFFDERMTKTYTVKTAIEGVKATYAKAEADEMTMINALVVSRDLEQSLLEKEFYNYFLGKDNDSKLLLSVIKRETKDHHDRVRQALEDERKLVAAPPSK